MELTLKDLLELLSNTDFHILFKPDGLITYRYSSVPESLFERTFKLTPERLYNFNLRVIEAPVEGEGIVSREFKNVNFLQLPKSLLERQVNKIARWDIDFRTSSTGRTVDESVNLEVVIK